MSDNELEAAYEGEELPVEPMPRKRRRRQHRDDAMVEGDVKASAATETVDPRSLVLALNEAINAYEGSLRQEAQSGKVLDYGARQMAKAQVTMDTVLRRPDLWKSLLEEHAILATCRRLLTCHKKRIRLPDGSGGFTLSRVSLIPPPQAVVEKVFQFLQRIPLDPNDGQGAPQQSKKWQKWPGLDRAAVAESHLGFVLETLRDSHDFAAPALKISAGDLVARFTDFLRPPDMARAARVRAQTRERRAAERADAAAEFGAGRDEVGGDVLAIFKPVISAEEAAVGVDKERYAALVAERKRRVGFSAAPVRKEIGAVAPPSSYDPRAITSVVCDVASGYSAGGGGGVVWGGALFSLFSNSDCFAQGAFFFSRQSWAWERSGRCG